MLQDLQPDFVLKFSKTLWGKLKKVWLIVFSLQFQSVIRAFIIPHCVAYLISSSFESSKT